MEEPLSFFVKIPKEDKTTIFLKPFKVMSFPTPQKLSDLMIYHSGITGVNQLKAHWMLRILVSIVAIAQWVWEYLCSIATMLPGNIAQALLFGYKNVF